MRVRSARDVGALIADRRRARGWSQQALADEAGVSRRWLVGLEGGKPGVELGLVLRVLAALGVELDADDPGSSRAGSSVRLEPRTLAEDLDELLATFDRSSP